LLIIRVEFVWQFLRGERPTGWRFAGFRRSRLLLADRVQANQQERAEQQESNV